MCRVWSFLQPHLRAKYTPHPLSNYLQKSYLFPSSEPKVEQEPKPETTTEKEDVWELEIEPKAK